MRKAAAFLSRAGLGLILPAWLTFALRAGRAFVMTTMALTFVFPAGTAFAQKKPITLDALQAWRNNAARATPGDPVWAPDGKTFVYRQGGEVEGVDGAPEKGEDLRELD